MSSKTDSNTEVKSTNKNSTSSPQKPPQKTTGWFAKFLGFVEWLGNLLPHPVTLFALFCLFVILFSGFAEWLGINAVDPRPEGKGRVEGGIIEVISLFSADGLRQIVTNLVTNFTGFAPLGTVLVALLGVSVAEHSGLLSAGMRSMVMGASKRMVTLTIV